MSENATGPDAVLRSEFGALELRRCLGEFATGVTVISATAGGEEHLMTANSFTSVSLEPPLVLVSVATSARMVDFLRVGGGFGVSILRADQLDVALRYAGKGTLDTDGLFAYADDVPLVKGATAHLVCEVVTARQHGDHIVFFGEVKRLSHQGGAPLVFHQGRFAGVAPRPGATPVRRQGREPVFGLDWQVEPQLADSA